MPREIANRSSGGFKSWNLAVLALGFVGTRLRERASKPEAIEALRAAARFAIRLQKYAYYRLGRDMDTRKPHLLIQGVFLFIAAASTTLLAELFLAGPILLAEGFKDNPLLYGSILLFVCLVCFLCFAGSRMESRRVVQFFSRLLLIFFSISAGLFAFEFLSLGIMSVAVGDKASLDNYLPLIGFLPLMFFVAAGIKHAFGLRARYWIIVLVVFVAALLGVFLSQGVVFLA